MPRNKISRVTCHSCGSVVYVEDVGNAIFGWKLKHFNKLHATKSAWSFRVDPEPENGWSDITALFPER